MRACQLAQTAMIVALTLTRVLAQGVCPGDCDQSGVVDITDLVRLTSTSTAACPSANLDDNAQISPVEQVTAIQSVLSGCVDPQRRLAALHTIVHALTRLPLLEPLFSLALSSAGTSADCDAGGGYVSDCGTSSDERVRLRTTSNACRGKTVEGAGVVSGDVAIVADGLCPYFVVPGSINLTLNATSDLEDSTSAPILSSVVKASSHIEGFFFDRPPCRVRGGVGTVTGDISYDGPGGASHINAQGLRVRFDLSQFQLDPVCDPGTIAATLNGSLTVIGDTFSVPTTTRDLNVTRHRLDDTVVIEGTVVADALGGEVAVHTIAPLHASLTNTIPTAGTLEVRTGGDVNQIDFQL